MASQAIAATRLLNHLLQGESVQGLRFGATQILFTCGAGKPRGEPYINLASAWAVYAERPQIFPSSEAAVPGARDEADEYMALVDLRHAVVERVEILEPLPHLIITFADSRLLFLWGGNNQYESWQAGQSFTDNENWLVVACPGGDLVAWAPEEFWTSAA